MNRWLILAGIASSLVCLLHVAVLFGGARWYRAFGAGEGMARLAERGSPMPSAITSALCVVFLIWALYAFSGAGLIRPLPMLVAVLWLIAAVYVLRGALLVPTMFGITPLRMLPTVKPHDAFTVYSSLVSLAIGVLYAVGTLRLMKGLPQ